MNRANVENEYPKKSLRESNPLTASIIALVSIRSLLDPEILHLNYTFNIIKLESYV